MMPEGAIGLVPAQGYGRSDQAQSTVALRYLAWIERERGIRIQTAGNSDAEMNLPGCGKVDGYISETKEVYEIGGVFVLFF